MIRLVLYFDFEAVDEKSILAIGQEIAAGQPGIKNWGTEQNLRNRWERQERGLMWSTDACNPCLGCPGFVEGDCVAPSGGMCNG